MVFKWFCYSQNLFLCFGFHKAIHEAVRKGVTREVTRVEKDSVPFPSCGFSYGQTVVQTDSSNLSLTSLHLSPVHDGHTGNNQGRKFDA